MSASFSGCVLCACFSLHQPADLWPSVPLAEGIRADVFEIDFRGLLAEQSHSFAQQRYSGRRAVRKTETAIERLKLTREGAIPVVTVAVKLSDSRFSCPALAGLGRSAIRAPAGCSAVAADVSRGGVGLCACAEHFRACTFAAPSCGLWHLRPTLLWTLLLDVCVRWRWGVGGHREEEVWWLWAGQGQMASYRLRMSYMLRT